MQVGIALGSNLGDRSRNIQRAQTAILSLPGVREPLTAPLFETAPVDCPPDSPAFLNTVMEVKTSLLPADLLHRLREIEESLGRPLDHARNVSRTIDLDLLYAGALVIDTPALTLPHPRIGERRFVLEPLAAIRPNLILPGQQKTVAELLRALEGDPHRP